MLTTAWAGITSSMSDSTETEQPLEGAYHVRIENFEGPLDLLLHLIKKNQINIYDIPIALITKQYLDYIEAMKTLNLAVAGDFLVMAATLLQIKSKMLLPVEEKESDEEEGPDPREELVRRLLEYKAYKEAASRLDEREKLWQDMFTRGMATPVDSVPDELSLEQVSLFDLVDALHKILARGSGKKLIEIVPDHLTVRDCMNKILERLETKESLTFEELFEPASHRLVVIVTFLALLELIRLRVARAFQASLFGPILVSRAFSLVPDPAEMDTSNME